MTYHGHPYEMQTEMSRGPLAKNEHSRKKMVGQSGLGGKGRGSQTDFGDVGDFCQHTP